MLTFNMSDYREGSLAHMPGGDWIVYLQSFIMKIWWYEEADNCPSLLHAIQKAAMHAVQKFLSFVWYCNTSDIFSFIRCLKWTAFYTFQMIFNSLDSQKIYFKVNLREYLKSFVAMRESVCVRANTKNINRMRKKTRGSQLMRRPIITCDSHTHKQEMTSAYWYGDLIHARTQSSFHLCSVSLPLPR